MNGSVPGFCGRAIEAAFTVAYTLERGATILSVANARELLDGPESKAAAVILSAAEDAWFLTKDERRLAFGVGTGPAHRPLGVPAQAQSSLRAASRRLVEALLPRTPPGGRAPIDRLNGHVPAGPGWTKEIEGLQIEAGDPIAAVLRLADGAGLSRHEILERMRATEGETT